MKNPYYLILFTLYSILFSCGKNEGPISPIMDSSEDEIPEIVDIEFTVLPMLEEDIVKIFPLGNMSPPGHTIPSDHIGFCHSTPPIEQNFVPKPVFIPASGYVRRIDITYDGLEIDGIAPHIQGNGRHWYYMGHFDLIEGVEIGQFYSAGDLIGYTHNRTIGIDFGIVDSRITNNFIRQERYFEKTKYGGKPLSYFSEELREILIPMVERDKKDEDGLFDFDVPGRLVGNWFHESLPYDESASLEEGWTRNLAFVFDPVESFRPVISTGGEYLPIGDWYASLNGPPFEEISINSGKVLFEVGGRGYEENGYDPKWKFLVEILDEETILIEHFPGLSNPTKFTEAAKIYKR